MSTVDHSTAPVFIVGLPRSGSTLWSNVIARHRNITLFTEMHFLNPWHKDFRYLMRQTGDLENDDNVLLLVDKLFEEPLVRGLRRGPYFWRSIRELQDAGLADALRQRLLDSGDRSIGFVFRALIEEATRCRGKSRAAVKFPVYPAYMQHLETWWPGCRIVHITRDPRAIAASKTNDPGGTGKLKQQYPLLKPVLPIVGMSFATMQYAWASHAHVRMRGKPDYRLFMYEQLMSDPEKTIRNLCDFCHLDFDISMLNPEAGQASSVTGLKSGGIDPSRAHGWREKLTPWQSRAISILAGPGMRRFGYDPE